MKKIVTVLLMSALLSGPALAADEEALPPKAAALKEKALKGDAASAYNLAVCYHFGKECPKSDEIAAKWLATAADKGDVDALVNLGDFYHEGLGVKQDDGKALQYYRAAAGHGSPEGEYNIGKMYANGSGVPADMTQAKQWYMRAGNQGLAEGQLELGRAYMQENDYENAYLWFGIAAKKNDEKAVTFRDRIGSTLTAEQVAAQQKKIAVWRPVMESDQRRGGASYAK